MEAVGIAVGSVIPAMLRGEENDGTIKRFKREGKCRRMKWKKCKVLKESMYLTTLNV